METNAVSAISSEIDSNVNWTTSNSIQALAAFRHITNLLNKEVSIFCWTTTVESNHKSKAIHIKATWAKRCTRHVFISNVNDANLGAIKFAGIGEGMAQTDFSKIDHSDRHRKLRRFLA